MPEPPPSRLRQLLQRPDARQRVSEAVVALLRVGVISIGVIGALTIWHLLRRGRLIRDSQPPPRNHSDHAGELPPVQSESNES